MQICEQSVCSECEGHAWNIYTDGTVLCASCGDDYSIEDFLTSNDPYDSTRKGD
jgi:hypothetical protein